MEGLEFEANTIRFVRQNAGEMPVSEVVYTWIDHDLNRTFFIMKLVRGQILDQAWPGLSPTDGQWYCTVLCYPCSKNVHPCFKQRSDVEFANLGCRSLLNRLFQRGYQGPSSSNALAANMKRASTKPPPEIDPLFHSL